MIGQNSWQETRECRNRRIIALLTRYPDVEMSQETDSEVLTGCRLVGRLRPLYRLLHGANGFLRMVCES